MPLARLRVTAACYRFCYRLPPETPQLLTDCTVTQPCVALRCDNRLVTENFLDHVGAGDLPHRTRIGYADTGRRVNVSRNSPRSCAAVTCWSVVRAGANCEQFSNSVHSCRVAGRGKP